MTECIPQRHRVTDRRVAGFAPFVSVAPVICSSSVIYLEVKLDAPDTTIGHTCEDRRKLKRQEAKLVPNCP